MLAQNRDEIRMRIALVQKDRFGCRRGEFELAMEGRALRGRWCEIAAVVKPTLTNGDDFRSRRERAYFGRNFRRPLLRVMWMHAGGGK
jgi:hypothetical protein